MKSTVVLTILGVIILALGIANIVVAKKYSDWEDKKYKDMRGKDAPKNLIRTTKIVGIVLSVIGALLLIWAFYIKMYPKQSVKSGVHIEH
jgi:uncharacterized membrane protein